LTDIPDAPVYAYGESPAQPAGEPPGGLIRYPFTFHGTGSEYFRIWIVNVFLTIITCGIYAAWAKVRTRRYFYSNTVLAGHSFEFLGNPRAILKGNLIIGAGALVYSLANNFVPIYGTFVALGFYLVFPWLIYKSLRFNFRNTSYRNIRFHFLGTMKSSYRVYLLWPLLVAVTLGILLPSWEFRKKDYVLNNFAYGATKNMFYGRIGRFYLVYATLLLIGPLALVIMVPLISALAGLSGSGLPAGSKDVFLKAMKFLPIVFTLIFMGFYTFFRQFLYVKINNYCFGQSSIGTATLESTMKVGRLTWIFVSNLMAIVFTVGLLAPWAKVRRTRYILESLAVYTGVGFDNFAAAAEGDVSAIGDAATDIFDIAIGL